MRDCPECEAYREANAVHLRGAAASVGIEHGLTAVEALTLLFEQYHEAGHTFRGTR